MPALYVVEQRKDAWEVVKWTGSSTSVYPRPLTEAFRRARMMAGERPGLVLEEVPIVAQVPLVFLGHPEDP